MVETSSVRLRLGFQADGNVRHSGAERVKVGQQGVGRDRVGSAYRRARFVLQEPGSRQGE